MKKTTFITAAALMFALGGLASAQKSSNPCEAAGKKYCSASTTFREFLECMEENKKSLSAACRSRVDYANKMTTLFWENKSACKDDAAKHCKGIKEGYLKCLIRNKSKLSKECQNDLKKWRQATSIMPQQLKEQIKNHFKSPPKKK